MSLKLTLRVARLRSIINPIKRVASSSEVDSLMDFIEAGKSNGKQHQEVVYVIAKEFHEPDARGNVAYIDVTYIPERLVDSEWAGKGGTIIGAPLNEEDYLEFLDRYKPNKVIQLPPQPKTLEEYQQMQEQAKQKHDEKTKKLNDEYHEMAQKKKEEAMESQRRGEEFDRMVREKARATR